MTDCIFCKIVTGDDPSYKIWEDTDHVAFLSIFPNTPGVTVVIPKKHYESYIFDLPDEILLKLVLASKKVGKLIDSKLEDVGRTGMICEGFGVNHAHIKLFPMHGTKSDEWKQHVGGPDKFFEHYEGYLSSHDYKQASEDSLSHIANLLK